MQEWSYHTQRERSPRGEVSMDRTTFSGLWELYPHRALKHLKRRMTQNDIKSNLNHVVDILCSHPYSLEGNLVYSITPSNTISNLKLGSDSYFLISLQTPVFSPLGSLQRFSLPTYYFIFLFLSTCTINPPLHLRTTELWCPELVCKHDPWGPYSSSSQKHSMKCHNQYSFIHSQALEMLFKAKAKSVINQGISELQKVGLSWTPGKSHKEQKTNQSDMRRWAHVLLNKI